MAIPAGAALDARWPSSLCSSGPRSQFAQIANEITIRSAEAKASVRPTSGIGAHLAGGGSAARVDRRRQRISEVDCLRLS